MTRAPQEERAGVVGSAQRGGSMWGQHPGRRPSLPKEHSHPSKVMQASGCLSLMSCRPLPASASPWRQEGMGGRARALGCWCLSACSHEQNLPAPTHARVGAATYSHCLPLLWAHSGLLILQTAGCTPLLLIALSPLLCVSRRSYLQEQTLQIPSLSKAQDSRCRQLPG